MYLEIVQCLCDILVVDNNKLSCGYSGSLAIARKLLVQYHFGGCASSNCPLISIVFVRMGCIILKNGEIDLGYRLSWSYFRVMGTVTKHRDTD